MQGMSEFTFIPAGISNHMSSQVWDQITYPFPNFNGITEVWEWISNFTPQFYNGCNYLSILGSKLIHVSKRILGSKLIHVSERCLRSICCKQAATGIMTTSMNQTWCNDISHMMTSSNGNIFCVTGHLCREFTSPQWIPCTKASDPKLWCFLSSASE